METLKPDLSIARGIIEPFTRELRFNVFDLFSHALHFFSQALHLFPQVYDGNDKGCDDGDKPRSIDVGRYLDLHGVDDDSVEWVRSASAARAAQTLKREQEKVSQFAGGALRPALGLLHYFHSNPANIPIQYHLG
jgi:hypothetical protein